MGSHRVGHDWSDLAAPSLWLTKSDHHSHLFPATNSAAMCLNSRANLSLAELPGRGISGLKDTCPLHSDTGRKAGPSARPPAGRGSPCPAICGEPPFPTAHPPGHSQPPTCPSHRVQPWRFPHSCGAPATGSVFSDSALGSGPALRWCPWGCLSSQPCPAGSLGLTGGGEKKKNHRTEGGPRHSQVLLLSHQCPSLKT